MASFYLYPYIYILCPWGSCLLCVVVYICLYIYVYKTNYLRTVFYFYIIPSIYVYLCLFKNSLFLPTGLLVYLCTSVMLSQFCNSIVSLISDGAGLQCCSHFKSSHFTLGSQERKRKLLLICFSFYSYIQQIWKVFPNRNLSN